MKVISFYVDQKDSTYYSDSAKKWIEAVESFGLDYYVEHLDVQDDYWKITQRKPQFIIDCLNKFKEPVLWIDIDNPPVEHPPNQHATIIVIKKKVKGKYVTSRYHSSALYFDYSPKALKFLNDWNALCMKGLQNKGDHHYLYKAIRSHRTSLAYFDTDFTNANEQQWSPFGKSIH